MDANGLIDRLESQPAILRALLEPVAPEMASWKPAADVWSISEVAGHLLDEERSDFRVRLDLTLHRPEDPWPPIDPVGWVTAHQYSERELGTTLREFLEERARSVAWLRGLRDPDWSRAHVHPAFGAMSAGDILGAWAAHDLLHARQIIRLCYRRLAEAARPYGIRYAGEW